MSDGLKYLVYGLLFGASLALIVMVISNSSKAEGMGVLGGGTSSQPQSRGRAGLEENLSRWTGYVAVTWMILCALVYYLAVRHGWE